MKSTRKVIETNEYTVKMNDEERKIIMNGLALYIDWYGVDREAFNKSQEMFNELKFKNISKV